MINQRSFVEIFILRSNTILTKMSILPVKYIHCNAGFKIKMIMSAPMTKTKLYNAWLTEKNFPSFFGKADAIKEATKMEKNVNKIFV